MRGGGVQLPKITMEVGQRVLSIRFLEKALRSRESEGVFSRDNHLGFGKRTMKKEGKRGRMRPLKNATGGGQIWSAPAWKQEIQNLCGGPGGV